MEWLVVDMEQLGSKVFAELLGKSDAEALLDKLAGTNKLGVTHRLMEFGKAIAALADDPEHDLIKSLSSHRSDIARQWAAYACQLMPLTRDAHLACAIRFATDSNMSVRECAWMAFRPAVVRDPNWAVKAMKGLVTHREPGVRRFAVEVTRPRSVWGVHVPALKLDPRPGATLLGPVADDTSRYVRLAVGNWINDAAKTRPDWPAQLFLEWAKLCVPVAPDVVRRGLRSINQ